MRFFIDELEVLFPYDYVYPEQIEYMRALKSTLGKGHSVLEMPTGTGKTITLLSLLLSYQYRYPDVGKLVYCTRTVHEMTKVMAELKNLMEFRERTIISDQEAFMQQYPDLAKKAIEVLTTVLEPTDNAVEDELNAALNASENIKAEPGTRRPRRHIQVGMDDADVSTETSSSSSSASASTGTVPATGTTDADTRQHTVESAVAVLVSQGFEASLATRAVLCMRSPAILGICLSSRRNMCIHPVVSQFDHRERVDSLCRGMTAQYVRERVLGELAAGTNASGRIVRESGNSGCGGACGGGGGGEEMDVDAGTGAGTDESMGAGDMSDVGATISRTRALTSTLSDIEDADRLGLCPYYEGLQSTGSAFRLKGVYDIEDLRALGGERMWCPYYATRQAIAQADVVVFNYQYMLDPKISSLVSGNIPENSVVVFDEAHNIDNICIEAMSITLNKNDIYAAGRGLNKLRVLVQECEAQNQQKLQDEYNKLVEQLLANNVDNAGDILEVAGSPLMDSDMLRETVPGSIRRAKHFVVLLKTLVEYMKVIIADTAVTQQSPELFIRKYQVETGVSDPTVLKYAYDRLSILLRTLEVSDVDDYASLLKLCSFITLCAYYGSPSPARNSFVPGGNAQFPLLRGPGAATTGSKDSFVILFEPFDGNQLPDARLQLVCVDATIAMQPVASKYSSVVITSGTITPLDMLPRILGVRPLVAQSFTMSLSRDVIVPLIASKGNDQNPLSTSFSSRETPAMALSYGHLLVALAKSIPDGMVVFFPSYIYMEHILQKWAELGIIAQLLQQKLVFLETKDIEETTLALSAYRKACSSGRGGIFFSIARGKVSEGIDFSGHLGRAVVLIGVPYQYTRSRQLLCRLDYLRDHVGVPESEYLHFDAMRQAAQCIGRIVRSKNDYGVVVLADHRYSRPDLKHKLPRWVQQFLLPEHASLSSESVVYAGKKFFRDSCMRGDVMTEAGVKGKVLLDGNQANRYASALADALYEHGGAGGEGGSDEGGSGVGGNVGVISGVNTEVMRNRLLSGRGGDATGRSTGANVSVRGTGSVVSIKFER